MAKRKPKNEKPDMPETPYLAARQEWNERYSNYISAANNWRLVALGSVLSSVILAAGLVWVSGQHKVVPYAVEFDNNGDITRVSRAIEASTPERRHMVSAMRNWIIGARTIYTDLQAQKAIIDTTYAMTYPDSACYQTLATFHRDNNPYRLSASRTVEVSVNAVMPVTPTTWQIDWTEQVKQRSGKPLGEPKQYQASISTVIAPPTDEAQILVNPLGIYAQDCSWTTRLNNSN